MADSIFEDLSLRGMLKQIALEAAAEQGIAVNMRNSLMDEVVTEMAL